MVRWLSRLKGLLGRLIPHRADRALGRLALEQLKSELVGPRRRAASSRSMRLIVLNHMYDQDIDAYLRAAFDCEIWILEERHIGGVRGFFRPEPQLSEDHSRGRIRRQSRLARRYFVGDAVEHLIHTARPDAVLSPSDIFYWFRPFILEFQARGILVAVQDKEGTLAPGELTADFLRMVLQNVPPIANKYYSWGPIHYESWVGAGLDPARIRVTGMPRSDLYYQANRRDALDTIGLQTGKRLVTCFTFEGDVYLTGDTKGRNIGRPWLDMRHEMHAAIGRIAAMWPDVQFVVKCHPQSQELEEIRRELAASPQNVSIMYGSATACNLIMNSAIVIGFQSTALIEAMLTDCPIVYCGWAAEHARYAPWLIPLSESGGCFNAVSADHFEELVLMLLDGRLAVADEMKDFRRAFCRRYFADSRGLAAECVLSELARDLGRQCDEKQE